MKKTFSMILCMLICISICTLAFSGCKSYKGEVNVFNWGEYISKGEDGSIDVISEFEKKYEIKVNYTNYETNEQMYSLLKKEGSNYDVIIPSDYMVSKLIEENMLEQLNYDNIPNFEKNVMEKYKTTTFDPGDKYSIPYSWGTVALVYNTDMVKEEIKGFSSLWDEKYKGKALMFNNARDAMAIAMSLSGITPTTATKEDVDTATKKLNQLTPNLKGYVMDQVFNLMEQNQCAIAPYYAGDIAMMMENNDKLAYCLPEEGANVFIDSMCIPKGSENKENAEKFINFMLEKDIAKANAELIGYSTPNQATYDELDDEIKNNKLVYPSDEYLAKCYTFSNLPDDVYVYMEDQFAKAIATKNMSE